MIIKAIVSYIIAAAVPIFSLFLLLKFLNKSGKKISALHTFIGALSFIAVLVGMFVLMIFAFSQNTTQSMTVYMSEGVYKITVSLLFFIALGIARYFLLNALYFNRYKENDGISFFLGYGICGGLVVSAYCIFMFFLVLFTALSSPFEALTDQSVLIFESGAKISAFTPFYAHILFSVIFVLYSVIMLVISMFMDFHSAHPYKKSSTFIMYLLTHICEILATMILLFATTSVSPIAIVIIFVCLTVLSALSVKLLYKYKEESAYDKQFE